MKRHQIFILLLIAGLAACGVRPRTVVQHPPGTTRPVASAPQVRGAGEHLVVRGDTLYGIAFRHGVDYRDLARWNGIKAPYTIYPGQRLRVTGRATASTSMTSAHTTASTASAQVVAPASTPVVGGGSSVNSRVGTASETVTPAPPTTSVPPAPVVAPVSPPATKPIIATGSTRLAQGINWRWPATGQVISRYVAGDQTRQGVGVAGSAGQPIVAAADGEVVYSGSGLIGYGELIIVRHSDEFLSAYGHNRKRLVNEGQKVKAGQQIAEMGRTGASRDMLHFEIRKNGKPLDPLGFLPAR